jgi:hypothetical protein
MKKLLGCLGALLLLFSMAGAASAGVLYLTPSQVDGVEAAISIDPTALPVYYPGEAIKGNNDFIDFNLNDRTANMPAAVVLKPGSVITRTIVYKPTTDLPSGTRIVFTLTNGVFGDSKLYLLANANPAGPYDGITYASSDVISQGTATFIVGNFPIPANTLLIMSASQDTNINGLMDATNIRVAMTTAAVGQQVSLAATQCFDAVGPIVGGLASAINLILNYQQFAFQVVPGFAVINVEAPSLRRMFLCYAEGCDTESYGNVTLYDQQGSVGDGFIIDLNLLGSNATIQYTVTGGQLLKLNRLYLEDGEYDVTRNFTINSDSQATISFAANSDPQDGQFPWYDQYADYLIFRVNGTSVLSPQTFNISGGLNLPSTDYNSDTLASTLVMTWGINGWQGTLPYMWASAVGQSTDTFIKIFNDSTVTGDVTVDVTPDLGPTTPNVALGSIPPGTVGTFWAADIAAAAGITLGAEGASFAALFTVNAPQNAVTAMSVQKRAAATERVVPIYTDETFGFMADDAILGGGGYKHW